MSDVKKVLVVDDHFEMLEFLRSMLELAEYEYEVMAVPSAEEGMLELRRAPFDLLITDVRLPGMSGFDLARRARTSNPDLPVIMITAYSSEQGRKEAADLGVYRYFTKPLDTDDVLTAINTLLYGEPEAPSSAEPPPQLDIVLPDSVRKRLETLSQDTAAAHVMLATVHGQVLLQVGRGREVDTVGLSAVIAQNLQNSANLITQLGGSELSTIQYYSGEDLELYTANIGAEYFMTIVFEVQVRRGRFGTIWVFAQRAIKDLLPVLPDLETAAQTAVTAPPARPTKTTPTPPPAKTTPPSAPPPTTSRRRSGRTTSTYSPPTPLTPPPPVAKAAPEPTEPRRRRRAMPPPQEEEPRPSAPPPPDFFVDAVADETAGTLDEAAVAMDVAELAKLLGSSESGSDSALAKADESWEAAAEASAAAESAMSFEDAMKMGLIDTGELSAMTGGEPTAVGDDLLLELDDTDLGELDGLFEFETESSGGEAVDLDSFWSDAIDDSAISGATSGMTFAEAREKGLIPGEIDFNEESEA